MKTTKCISYISAVAHALRTGETATWDIDGGSVCEVVKSGTRKFQVFEVIGGERRELKTRERSARF